MGILAVVFVFSSINRRKAAEHEANLGNQAYKSKDFSRALTHFTRAVKLHPTAKNWTGIATTQFRLKNYTESVHASTRALAYASRQGGDPQQLTSLYELRGTSYTRVGSYRDALTDYEAGIKLSPDARLYNSLAWLLATAPDPDIRNGERAVRLAREACAMKKWSNAGHLDTLAAAYARIGQFQKAVGYQQEAILMENDLMSLHDYYERLELYQKSKPYTEGVDN
ncbi:MAG: tetratricopeptide repeat protein [Armatimonadota bacterium]